MKKNKNISINLIINILVFIATIFIFGNLFNLLYFSSLSYKNDFYKFNNLTFINKLYVDMNIKTGNCNLINEYLSYKIDLSPIENSENSFQEIINMTTKCNNLNDDYLFLKLVYANPGSINWDEHKNIKFLGKYWYFIRQKNIDEIESSIKNKENKEIFNLYKNQFL